MKNKLISFSAAAILSGLSLGTLQADTLESGNSLRSLVLSARNTNIIQRAELKRNRTNRKRKPSGLNSVCPKGTRKIGFGVLYKPSADSTDSRRGKPVVLLQGSNETRTSSLNIYNAAGKSVCKFSFKAPNVPGTNGNSDHYWSGWSGGCGKTGSQIASLARSAGSTNIYIQANGGQCFGPINPTSRVGAIGG